MKTAKRERTPGVTVKNIKAPMTKQVMILEIQQQEAEAWLKLKQAEHDFGSNDVWVFTLRARWAAINDVMTAVGISSDHSLWANQEATRIVMERLA